MSPPDLHDLAGDEPLRAWEPLNDHLALGVPRGNWQAVAEWFSRWNGGIWLAGTGGVTWRCGAYSWWLIHPDDLAELIEARQVAASLGVETGWSIGSVATRLARWVGKPPEYDRDKERLISGVSYNYIEATPGEWAEGSHYDVSAYYFSILQRLPTLRPVVLSSGRLIWCRWEPGEEERWRSLLAAVEPHKRLRNSLVGVMVGRKPGRVYFHQGEAREMKGCPGPWSTAAWAVVRAGWEVTRRCAVETDAVWAHTDAVIAPGGLYPETWDRLGFRVKSLGRGPVEVYTAINYRCGPDRTRYYDRGSRWAEPTPRPELPPVEYHRQWLDVSPRGRKRA